MNYALLFFIILIAFVFLHGTNAGSLMALLIIMFVGFIIHKKPEKKDQWKKKRDFFTNPETSPFAPYMELLDDEEYCKKLVQVLKDAGINDNTLSEILAQVMQQRVQGKYSLFIQNPSAAMTLASYYNVFKKMKELDSKKKKPKTVYYCPLCFRVYNESEASKNNYKCPKCNVKLVSVKSPFAANFANTLATPFSDLFSKLLEKKSS